MVPARRLSGEPEALLQRVRASRPTLPDPLPGGGIGPENVWADSESAAQ
jgi:hypothetical protein